MEAIGGTPQRTRKFSSRRKRRNGKTININWCNCCLRSRKITLGHKGMDKIIQPLSTEGGNEKIIITNDRATILKSIYVDNLAAKILIDISKTQDKVVGDGTTTVAVLAGKLLREAEKLITQKIHPQIFINGFRIARDKARETLNKIWMNNKSNEDQFRNDLLNIARTTLSSKLLNHEKDFFANIVVDAILRFKHDTPDLDHIKITKKPGGSLKDSFLSDGFILEKTISVECPKVKRDAKIMLLILPWIMIRLKSTDLELKSIILKKSERLNKLKRKR